MSSRGRLVVDYDTEQAAADRVTGEVAAQQALNRRSLNRVDLARSQRRLTEIEEEEEDDS